MNATQVIDEFKQVFPNLVEIARSLAEEPGIAGFRAVVGDEPEGGGREADLKDLLRQGQEGVRKLREGLDDEVTPEEQQGLEAIIHLKGRPAILVQDGRFFPAPQEWRVLEDHRAAIEAVLQRVGRIEVEGHREYDWIGTGFLAGPRVVITNEHVAREFAHQASGAWTFRPGHTARLDFKEEFGGLESQEVPVVGVLGVHEDLDLAFLELADEAVDRLPTPLPVAASPPSEAAEGRAVYVVGYPAWDGRRNDGEVMRRIFSGIYDVKRLAPGTIRELHAAEQFFIHDSSTLGGNSGSPVLDLLTHRVLGLHYWGRYLTGNRAIPLWLLQADPLVKRAGLAWA